MKCVLVCVSGVNLNAEQRAVRETEEHIVKHIRIPLHYRLNSISRLLMQTLLQQLELSYILLHLIEVNLISSLRTVSKPEVML